MFSILSTESMHFPLFIYQNLAESCTCLPPNLCCIKMSQERIHFTDNLNSAFDLALFLLYHTLRMESQNTGRDVFRLSQASHSTDDFR